MAADEISSNAQQAARNEEGYIEWIGNGAIMAFGGALGAIAHHMIEEDRLRLKCNVLNATVDALKRSLSDINSENKRLKEMLQAQCTDTNKVYDNKKNELIIAGKNEIEAVDVAAEEANKYWLNVYGDKNAFFTIDNVNVRDMEERMSKAGIPFIMIQSSDQIGADRSVYYVKGEDASKITELANDLMKEQSLHINDDREANEIFKGGYVQTIDSLTPYQAEYIQKNLDMAGIMSEREEKIKAGGGREASLVIKTDDIENNRDYFDHVIGVSRIIGMSKIQQQLDKIESLKSRINRAFTHVISTDYDKNEPAQTFFDSAHPENYIRVEAGGADIYEKGVKTETIDLSADEGRDRLSEEYDKYVLPIRADKEVKDVEYDRLAQFWNVESSLLSSRAALEKELEQNFEMERKISLNTHDHPELEISKREPAVSYDLIEKEDENLDTKDNALEGQTSVMNGIIENAQSPDTAETLAAKIQSINNDISISKKAMYEQREIESSVPVLEDRSRERNGRGDLDHNGASEPDNEKEKSLADRDEEEKDLSAEVDISDSDEISADDFGEEPDESDFI